MIIRLKAPNRTALEAQIPFDLYREDEEGGEIFVPATEEYSYVFRGHEVLEEAEFDEDGNMTKEPVLSNYVMANLRIYTDVNPSFDPEVSRRFPDNPRHGWT